MPDDAASGSPARWLGQPLFATEYKGGLQLYREELCVIRKIVPLASSLTSRALATLAQLEGEGRPNGFDLVFIDADKTNYDVYYEAAFRLVHPGGLIVLDNMRRRGRGPIRAMATRTRSPCAA